MDIDDCLRVVRVVQRSVVPNVVSHPSKETIDERETYACVQVETSFNSDSRDENDRFPRTVTVYEFERRGSRQGIVQDVWKTGHPV